MKTVIVVALMLGMVSTPAYAIERSDWNWTALDTVGQAAITILLVLDRNQSVEVSKLGLETNLVLGRGPSIRAVNTYFAASMLLSAGIAVALPKPYRNIFQGVVIGCEANTVWANYRVGISMRF